MNVSTHLLKVKSSSFHFWTKSTSSKGKSKKKLQTWKVWFKKTIKHHTSLIEWIHSSLKPSWKSPAVLSSEKLIFHLTFWVRLRLHITTLSSSWKDTESQLEFLASDIWNRQLNQIPVSFFIFSVIYTCFNVHIRDSWPLRLSQIIHNTNLRILHGKINTSLRSTDLDLPTSNNLTGA